MTTSIFRITRRLTYTKTLNVIQKLINRCVHVGDPIILPAGTATIAPLTFTDGPLVTSPLEGSMEFLNGRLYFTAVDGIRYALTLSSGVKTDTTTVTNTTTETILFTKIFTANEFFAGNMVQLLALGDFTNASAADDFTIRFKINGVTIQTITRVGGNQTDAGWRLMATITVRTDGPSGTLINYVEYVEDGSTTQAFAGTGTTAIDTTATLTFEVTLEWNNAKAGNTFNCSQGSVTFKH